MKVTRSDGTKNLRLSGTIEAERSTTLSFAVVDSIEQVFVKEGQNVEPGSNFAAREPRETISLEMIGHSISRIAA